MNARCGALGVRLAVLLWVLALAVAAAGAQELRPVPALSARVIDQTGTLNAAQLGALDAKLAAFEASAGTQIVVLMVPTTAPEDIAAYAWRVADTWKIGRRDVGDGLLVVVAKDDRAVRIEVARALEGAVPDLAARQIIDRAMVPAFRSGDFAGGIDAALDQLMARVKGEALPAPGPRQRGGDAGVDLGQVAIFFFAGVPIVGAVLTGMFGRKIGSVLTGGAAGAAGWLISASVAIGVAAGVLALLLVGLLGIGAAGRAAGSGRGGGWPPMGPPGGGWGGGRRGGGGGFGGGFGGGGFGSGGGGSFGGGGASGRW
jgi:uncharacterized protein